MKATEVRVNRMRWVRGVGALGALLLLLGAIPLLLAGTIGDPTRGWPDLVAGDVTDAVLIDLLAAVAWLAWAQFAVAAIVEMASALRQTPMPRRIPGVLASQQQLARMLVTALLLSPAVATAVLHSTPVARADTPTMHSVGIIATYAVAAGVPQPAAYPRTAETQQALGKHDRADHPQLRPDDEQAGELPAEVSGKARASVYLVPAGDGPATYWDLAAVRLGSGQRWQEIWHLNEGRRQADGTVMTSPRLLRPGWTVLLPDADNSQHPPGTRPGSPATPNLGSDTLDVTVRAGDTLAQIAADHGRGDWRPTWQANAGRVEPDGSHFTNPDLIRPDWTITLPAPASPAAHTPASTPPPKEPRTPATVPAPALPSPSRRIAPPEPDLAVPSTARSTEASAAAATSAAHPHDSGAGASHDAGRVENSPATSELLPTVAFGGGGALLAALTVTALRRHRRRQFRDRALGRTITATPPDLAPIEKALLASATTGTADVTWLDEALRSLVHTLASVPDGRLPDVMAVRMTRDVLELVLTTSQHDAPAPWRVEPSGLRWSVGREDRLPFDPADRVFHYAPYPTLVTVGASASGEHWLLDLERIGVLTLTGDPQRCDDLGRFLAAELAHNCWSEQLHVTLAGFGEQLRGLNPSRVNHALGRRDVNEAVVALRTALTENTTVAEQVGVDVLTGRLRNINGDVWTPHVLMIAPEADADARGLERLLDALRTEPARTAIGVVLVGEQDGRDEGEEAPSMGTGWRLHLAVDGTLTIPALGVQLRAQQLSASEAADLAALLTLAADSSDQPVPPARGTQPWDAYADAAGALMPDLTDPRPVGVPPRQHGVIDLTDTTPPGPETTDSVLPMPSDAYLERAATAVADLEALAPEVNDDLRRRVQDADPDLDVDLADWHDPHSRRPKLRLLGPVTLTASGQAPDKRPAFYTEVVAYLASRPHGATLEQFASALWPNDPDMASKTAPRQAASVARTWLGINSRTGEHHLPKAPGGTAGVGVYRVQDLLVDAELFRRLRLQGVAGSADGIADLETALDLVTGVPLEQRRPDGYSWLVDLPIEAEYTGMIVDVAHLVATHHLAAGTPDRALAAAKTALRAGACDDVALLDLVAACDAVGNHAEADRYVQRILANHDAEVQEDLPSRTYEVLRHRKWLPPGNDPVHAG